MKAFIGSQTLSTVRFSLFTMVALFTFSFSLFTAAQQPNLDSLWGVWNDQTQPDTSRLEAIEKIAWDGFLFSKPDSAFYYAQLQYEFAQRKGLGEQEAKALRIQGITLLIRRNLDQALVFFERSLALQREIGDRKGAAGTLNNMGNVYREQGLMDKALELTQQSLAIRKELGDLDGISSSLMNLGDHYFLEDKYTESQESFQECLRIRKEIGDQKGIGEVHSNLGNVYSRQGNLAKALEHYMIGLQISKELNNKRGIGASLAQIGSMHILQDNHSEALDYYGQALVIFRETGNRQWEVLALMNIGSRHRALEDYPLALDYLRQGVDLAIELGDERNLAKLYYNIGLTYNYQGNVPLAFEHFEKALLIQQRIEDRDGSALSLTLLGNVKRSLGENKAAIGYCKEGLGLATEIGALKLQRGACNCLYSAYKALGNTKDALLYFEQVAQLNDTLNETETAKKLQRLEFDKELLADSLHQEEEKHVMEMAHQEEVAKKDRTRNLLMGGGLLLFIAAIGLFSRNQYVNRSKKQIQKEKDRSEELLLNILPEEVAEELKEKGAAEAQLIDETTVLFTDFKGFTAMAEKLSPKELVNDLNTCFSEFDRITAKYGIEKIKTIGDAYMAAGGLPTPNTTHATDVIKAAFEMRDFVEAGKARKIAAGLPYFEIRIGIHTGPVVAGIVGVKKFQYDIWGDTVNTASRMESSGEVGKVNISEATHKLVKNNPEFGFTSRGKVQAKGKGEMEMLFVKLRK